MIRFPAAGARYGAIALDPEARHHGAVNSALKNSAPSSLTTLRTSESTSMPIASPICAFVPRIWADRSSLEPAAGCTIIAKVANARAGTTTERRTTTMNATTHEIETNKGSDQSKKKGTTSARAEALAKRIEEGAA